MFGDDTLVVQHEQEEPMRKSIAIMSVIGAVCAAAGGAAGISSSAAATSGTSAQRPPAGQPGHPPHGPGGGGIHSETVVPDRDGTGFTTIVGDAGTLSAIDGSTLTLKEGTDDETYATVDVVADGTVTVRRNGRTVELSALKVGDHVRVVKDGTTTRVDASTAAWEARQPKPPTRGTGPGAPPAITWPAA
jgi:hypothetical protein